MSESPPSANGADVSTTADGNDAGPLLEARSLSAGYGRVPVVRDLNLQLHRGEVVALLGSNGAGKTTTIKTLSGQLTPSEGHVLWDGASTKAPLHKRAKRGLALVPENRSVFSSLSTLDNLRLARGDTEAALRLFPALSSRLSTRAGSLSGGEQQMLSLARALSRGPRVLLADELSLGLAPIIVDRLYETVRAAADQGVAILLVEQHVRKVLAFVDRGYIMRRGRIVATGTGAELRDRIDEIEASYLSSSSVEP